MTVTSQHVALDPLDASALEFETLLREPQRAASLRARLIRESFSRHINRQPQYRSYARRLGIDDDPEISLSRIPLLPSSLFKRRDVMLSSVPAQEIVRRCVSSGTLGSRSVVPRDETTLTRFLSSVTAALPALFGVDRTALYRGIVLGPTAADAGALWLAFATACVSLIMRAEYFERRGVYLVEEAVQRIAEAASEGLDLVIIGPPHRVLEASELARRRPGHHGLSTGSYVITAGGWKTHNDAQIVPEQFRRAVATGFRMGDLGHIRDSYNMVELNSVIHECEAHEKHVPPWVEVQCRDAATNALLPAGRTGILAFLDASATSYPGFILSEDFGTVTDDVCVCGRGGQRLRIVRRMKRIESRGCALKMASFDAADGPSRSGTNRFFRSIYRDAPRKGTAP